IPKLDNGEKITIVFCDDEDVIAENDTQIYVYESAKELKELFPEHIEIEFLNVWEYPKRARELGVTHSLDVVVMTDDSSNVISQSSLFVTDTTTQTVIAYHGEKRIAAAMMKVVSEESPMCYVTVNHGEQLDSYELLYTLADAGYTCSFLDLLNFDIPEDCELLLTVDPKQDMTSNENSNTVSEVAKIQSYLDRGGNYMVFLAPETFAGGGLANFEALLEDWGVDFAHSKGESGSEEYYQIKDASHAVSIDGYTIFGQIANSGAASEMFDSDAKSPIFKNATSINVADGYKSIENGAFSANIDGRERVFTPLLSSYNTAEAYAGGRVVKKASDGEFTLMSMTTQSYNGLESRVVVCASTGFTSEESLQSVVYGNGEVISSVVREMGRDGSPYMLKAKPFPTTEMKSITTKTATVITVSITSFFAICAIVSGVIVLTKRKNAM
ncbi:MAG: Gldg family protein, partial [Clostridia bacterium]|nr:Gldg family protein [Clostridia bacterium]